MCGRARCTMRPDDIPRACNVNARPVRHLNMDRYRPSFNVAPGFNVPVVRRDDGGDSDGVVLHCMKWGLVPSFTKKTDKIDHFKMFNARCESIREKASFRRLLPNNRCLVAVEGFYEWKKDGSKKQPYYIYFKDGRPLVFAALFDSWRSSEGEVLYTFTIITTSSSRSLEWLHDRMPVILGDKESRDMWLNALSSSNLDKILKPYEEADLGWYPVTSAVGKLSFDGPECVKELQIKLEETKSISQFFSKKELHGRPEPKLEKSPIKEENMGARQQKSLKEEPESVTISQNTIMKDEPVEASRDKNVKEEHDSQSIFETISTEDEPADDSRQKRVKEETGTPDDCHPSMTDKDDNKSDVSSVLRKDILTKREYEEISSHSKKPLAEETDKQHTGQVRKKGKVADDKQPTLFSYFGRS